VKIIKKSKKLKNDVKPKSKKNNEEHRQEIQNLERQNQENLEKLRKTFINTYNMNDDRRNSSIELSKPLFWANNKDPHPIEFLQNLEEYFRIKQISREEKLIIVRDCLKNAASNWCSTVKFQVRNYSDFRNAFIDEFWSRQIQIQTWSECLNTTQVGENITYREHFARWASKL